MSGNQKIDGVPRNLLERFLKGSTTGAERRELQSLLDNPVEEVDDEQWYADTPDGDSALVTRVGALTEWQKGRDGMREERDAALRELSELKAAQHQGEPVAEVEREFDNSPAHVHLYQDLPDGTKLFAEPPAPVAVVMPERMDAAPFTTIDLGSKNYKAGYNAGLAEVARLNGVKP